MAQIINDTFGCCGTPGCQSVSAVGLGVVVRVTSSALGLLSPDSALMETSQPQCTNCPEIGIYQLQTF